MNHAFRAQLFAHVVDAHGAAETFAKLLKTNPRGRKKRSNPRTFLILLLLAAADGEVTIEHMHQIATQGLPRDLQQELDILRPSPDHAIAPDPAAGPDLDDNLVVMPVDELYYLSRVFTKKLATSGPHAAGLTDEELDRRRDALHDLADRLILGTLPDRPGASYAIDESAIWAWAKGRKTRTPARQPADAIDDRTDGTVHDRAEGDDEPVGRDLDEPPVEPDGAGGAEVVRRARHLSACPDAAWGTKTGKNGEQDAYFGYALHALVRVPDLQAGPAFSDEDDPVLIEAFAVTPASTDVVDVSLGLLDRVAARRTVRDLIADRHYSYKEWTRWAHQLWTRGIRPVADLREDEHGFREYKGAKIAASWPHCPGVPPRLGTILRPGPGAASVERERFADRIEERQRYAMRRVKSHVPDGASRWECPARAGKIGCPLVAGSVPAAQELDLPIVANPPEGPHLPDCCTQRTFMIRASAPDGTETRAERTAKLKLGQTMKHAQDEYWGEHRWVISWNRRTHVEGTFGNLKNPNTENLRRGQFRFTGLPLVTLAVAATAAAANTRQLRNWHARTGNGDPSHPLLAPEPTYHGFTLLKASTSPSDGADRADGRDDLPRAA